MLLLISPVLAPVIFLRYVTGKSRDGWADRMGRLKSALVADETTKPRIWIHAVSAGEVVAAIPILRDVRALLTDFEIVFSVTTPAGMEMALKQGRPYLDQLFYFPLDLPWIVRKVVAQIRPRVFVSLESELWPNMLHELKRRGARTIMVNGRITERNFRRIRGPGVHIFRWMFSNIDRLLVQSEPDAARIRAIGGLQVAGRIAVLGNSKFDQAIAALSMEEAERLRADLHLPTGAPVFVAGSTRSPAEEAVVVRAYQLMREEIPSLCLVMAPRQIDRAGEVAGAMRSAGLEPVRKTELDGHSEVRHLILDTMGELAAVYSVASVAFVGNSFEPVVKGGGQNLVQPLAHGKPVLFGPKTATIRSEVALATEARVGFRVQSAEQMAEKALQLLRDERALREMNERARQLILSQQGVARRYAEAVAELARGEQH